MSLRIEHVTGGYTRRPILNDLSFNVADGELVGLIGLNGAGKSTTIKHIMGLLEPFEGKIFLNDKTIHMDSTLYRRNIGFIPETPVLYEELTLKEHIEITAMAYGLDVDRAFKSATPLLKLFRLDGRLEWFPSDFSKGMKQKVMIVCAFIIEPSLYVIDEPFLGLDPLAIRDFLKLLNEKKEQGASILMSTHVLNNAEKICDAFVILHNGKIYAKGTLSQLREKFKMPGASLDDMYGRLADEEGFLI
ncbi:ABC transporter, ATP-binding protein EcsA [Marinilactibacillus psychrotolerans 42ea]|uniref:ABC transporter, ATP-binding protein EcsA n=1 Tax=Marinilactibacillus psychrotolerans 42ea TaxID=1255609 RepID=A0A1R4JCS4_9LACT|nr:ABC transporter ATP-binding protein [Marinilactibacillus psychrotolerans]SJN29847.1 ABC transporter, ATP-binding protein EcsA [Marinilactibacillus psychrotolerans 42ea]